MLFQITGRLQFSLSLQGEYKLIANVDPSISNFYRSLIPKYLKVNKQKYEPHVSIVRNEVPKKFEAWNRIFGQIKTVDLEINSDIKNDETYYWLEVYSKHLTNIRLELGLEESSEWSRAPDGSHCFHMTIGNTKHVIG